MVGGLAVVGLLLLGLTVVSWPWSIEAPPPVEQAEHVPDDVPSPTLLGRGEPDSDTVGITDATSPVTNEVEKPAKIDEEAPLAEDAADRVEVVVRVVDEKGQPVEGLGICEYLRRPGEPFDTETRLVGRTDAHGLTVVLVSENAARLGIERNDAWHVDGAGPSVPESGGEVVITVLPGIVVTGVLLDESGAPVEGAQFYARFSMRSERGSSSMALYQCGPTDQGGAFTVSLPSYTEYVTFDVRGEGASASARLDLSKQREVMIRLQPHVWIRGEVVTEDGTPLVASMPTTQHVAVTPVGGGLEVHGLLMRDGAGSFAVRVPRPGRYRLSISWKPRNATSLGTPDPVIVEAPVEGVRLVCPRGHGLSGHLRGEDVEGFRVMWARNTGDHQLLQVRHRTQTDAAGRFVLKGLTEGATVLYVCRLADERFGLLERVRLPAEDLDIPLQRGLTIRGHVQDYTGRHGFSLWLYFTWRGPPIGAEVRDDGTFLVTGLPPGMYGVRWSRAGKAGDLDLEVEAGTEDVEVILPEEVLRMGQTPER